MGGGGGGGGGQVCEFLSKLILLNLIIVLILPSWFIDIFSFPPASSGTK